MSYTFRLQNLDCANCAAKMERAINKVEGIKSCTINFFSLKMRLETLIDMSEELFERVSAAAKKVERKIQISL